MTGVRPRGPGPSRQQAAADGAVGVPLGADLDAWAARSWDDGVQVDRLEALDQIVVRTRNTTYEITILDPHSGDVAVRGGRFFPQSTRARVGGSSLGGSFLKLRGIYRGFCVEFYYGEREWIVTTPVQSITAASREAVH